jgi:hypothetical protein
VVAVTEALTVSLEELVANTQMRPLEHLIPAVAVAELTLKIIMVLRVDLESLCFAGLHQIA